MHAPVENRSVRRWNALERDDRAEPERPQRRELEAAVQSRDVCERVGAGVAVGAGVGERADAARVEDYYERAHAAIATAAHRSTRRSVLPVPIVEPLQATDHAESPERDL